MKTQNNNQETVISQVRKMVLYTSAVILSVALVSKTATAQDFWKQLSNTNTYGKMASLMVDQFSETEITNADYETLHSEVSTRANNSTESISYEPEMEETMQVEGWMTNESNFNSNIDFNALETEQTMEIEDWMTNSNNFSNPMSSESVEMEKPLQIEPWMTTGNYFNSTEVVESAEPGLEIEGWMTDESKFNSLAGIDKVDIQEAFEYNAEEFVNAELELEKETLMNGNAETVNQVIEAESALQIDALTNEIKYNADEFVEPEMQLEIESWMTNEDFLESADAFTANGSDQEIAKYAQNVILATETEPALEVQAWMTNENFFRAAELLTSLEAELECSKYAQRQLDFESNRDGK